MRHRPVRLWIMPWKKRCACGCAWYPCPDAVRMDTEGPRLPHDYPYWNAPTATHSSEAHYGRTLMTPGHQWRARRRAR